jgi:hypothetical protein
MHTFVIVIDCDAEPLLIYGLDANCRITVSVDFSIRLN